MKNIKIFAIVLLVMVGVSSCVKYAYPERSKECDITSFEIEGVTGNIDQTKKTINVVLPVGTDITALTPVVTVSEKAIYTPIATKKVNFTNPVTYFVMAEDANVTAKYVVTVKATGSPVLENTEENIAD